MILDGRDLASITSAAQALHQGELVGLPTETVYGLGADAGNDAAVAKIFAAKGRPADHPLIVHVADEAGVAHFAQDLPVFAHALIQAFWPGPLTLILPRRPDVGATAAAGQNSVGLRCPSHPVAHALLLACRALGVHGLAAQPAGPLMNAGQANELCARSLQLMEAGTVAIPELARAGAPIIENAKQAAVNLKQRTGNLQFTYTFLTSLRSFVVLSDSVTKPFPFPAEASRQR